MTKETRDRAWQQGYDACYAGLKRNRNHYHQLSAEHDQWDDGYQHAMQEIENENND